MRHMGSMGGKKCKDVFVQFFIDHHREKISKKLLGVKHTKERNIRKSIRQRKSFLITKNNLDVIRTDNLKKWCIDNNYTYCCLFNLKAKRIKSYKDLINIEQIYYL